MKPFFSPRRFLQPKLLSLLVATVLFTGCSYLPPVSDVKPWEKGTLADPDMAPGGLARDNGLFSHVYTSKEAARGGEGVGGGGCGCN
ncbi:MAG: hypothetical protein CSA52_01525 [Gammaproteobacteria bacterium]|nr:MAG: hypothetical protein CSB48_09415 [Pseudomonadota bacterium]PIE38671.1 MAG: hypothetical protein CSA52_01525 [Gammaproteobacteria bacterium]